MAKRLREVEAEVQAKASEVSMSKEEAKRWEARSQELLQKMQTVDPREHQRVCDELKVWRLLHFVSALPTKTHLAYPRLVFLPQALKESSAASAAAAAEAKKALEVIGSYDLDPLVPTCLPLPRLPVSPQ